MWKFIKTCENSPIYIRVLVSALLGIFLTCVFIYPFTYAAFHYFHHDNDYWFRDFNFLTMMVRGPGLYPFALIITTPLILISMGVSFIFRKNIEKRLLVWCVSAPMSICLFVIVFVSLTRDNTYYQTHSFIENFVVTFKSAGNLLYLFGPAPAAAIFYCLSVKPKKDQI